MSATTNQRSLPAGLRRLFRPLTAGRGAILCLHRVLPEGARSRLPILRDLELTTGFLAALLERLAALGCDFVSMDELAGDLGAKRRRCQLAVTLDDGYRDNLEHALPLFERLGVPFTVYVTTGLIDGTADAWWYGLQTLVQTRAEVLVPPLSTVDREAPTRRPARTPVEQEAAYRALYRSVGEAGPGRAAALAAIWRAQGLEGPPAMPGLFLSWDEIRTLAASPLATIGAHTVTHPRLAWLPPEGILEELRDSRLRLESELGRPVRHLAYPHGSERDLPAGIAALAREAGYATGVTTIPRPLRRDDASRPWTLPRITVPGDPEDLELAERLILGWEASLRPRLRRRLAAAARHFE